MHARSTTFRRRSRQAFGGNCFLVPSGRASGRSYQRLQAGKKFGIAVSNMPQFDSHDTAVFGDSLADQVVLQGVEPGNGWDTVQHALTSVCRTAVRRCPAKLRGSSLLSHWHRERRRGFPGSIQFFGFRPLFFQMMATRHRSIPGSCKIVFPIHLPITSRRCPLSYRYLQSWRKNSNRLKTFSPRNYNLRTRERPLPTKPSHQSSLRFLFPGLVQLRRTSR